MSKAKNARYQSIARRLSQDAEDNVHISVYITEEDVAEALGDATYDPDEDEYKTLTEWIEKRRMLGFDPSSQDILDWIADQTVPEVKAA